MIKFINLLNDEPYKMFNNFYSKAYKKSQKNIEAIAISSYDSKKNQVNSRYVNLKYINEDRWVFFTNYNSPKANEFMMNNNIHGLFYWNNINVQIRMKGKIKKISAKISDEHFKKRKKEKNAVAIISKQSSKISSYDEVLNNYEFLIKNSKDLKKRPDYWGGFSFTPNYFEFWTGNENRINKRHGYKKKGNKWDSFILQP